MLYFLYWLNEAAFFNSQARDDEDEDDDNVSYLDRGKGVNMSDILREHRKGDGWGEQPDWK